MWKKPCLLHLDLANLQQSNRYQEITNVTDMYSRRLSDNVQSNMSNSERASTQIHLILDLDGGTARTVSDQLQNLRLLGHEGGQPVNFHVIMDSNWVSKQ